MGIRSIACGASHVVAVDTGGRAFSWGSAQYGQLGCSSPPKTFSAPPACDPRDKRRTPTTQHQPTMIQSVSRIHIMKAACGLHHSLLVSEVAGESRVSLRTATTDRETRFLRLLRPWTMEAEMRERARHCPTSNVAQTGT